MKDNANLPNANSIVNTYLQTELLFEFHEYIKTSFLTDPEYNPATDPYLNDLAQQFSINISFMGDNETKFIQLKNGEVSYDRFPNRRTKNTFSC